MGWSPRIATTRGQLTSLANSAGGTGASTFTSFTYDASGNRLTYTQNTPLVTGVTTVDPDTGGMVTRSAAGLYGVVSLAYDNQDHLRQENSQRQTQSGGGNDRYLSTYTYTHVSDPADNLTSLRNNAVTSNADNQVIGANGFGSAAFSYDGQGNPTLYQNVPLAYDQDDQLSAFNGGVFTAGYRPDGLRAWKQTGSGGRTYFLYEGGHVVAELNASGAVTSLYGWGAGGLVERRAVGVDTYAYTFDPSGNLVQRHSGTGFSYKDPTLLNNIAADYTTCYDAFGAQLGAVDASTGRQTNSQDAIGWGGQWGGYTDQETTARTGTGGSPLARTPLVLCGLRYYDPSTGRFLSRDPIGMEGGVNLYAYTRNNPVNDSDPMGTAGVGHHLVPQSLFRKAGIPEDALKFFNKVVSGPLTKGHRWSKAHKLYNEEVARLWESWLSRRGIDASKMTVTQAAEFVEIVKKSNNPVVRDFLRDITTKLSERASIEIERKAAQKLEQKAARGIFNMVERKVAQKFLKQAAKAAFKKVPIVAIGFFLYDLHQGGFVHAANQAVWPASELWGGE